MDRYGFTWILQNLHFHSMPMRLQQIWVIDIVCGVTNKTISKGNCICWIILPCINPNPDLFYMYIYIYILYRYKSWTNPMKSRMNPYQLPAFLECLAFILAWWICRSKSTSQFQGLSGSDSTCDLVPQEKKTTRWLLCLVVPPYLFIYIYTHTYMCMYVYVCV